MTAGRQTDHATEKCVAIGGIACAARAIPPKTVRFALWGRCLVLQQSVKIAH